MLLRYNGMLIGVNELLDDARSRAMAAGQPWRAARLLAGRCPAAGRPGGVPARATDAADLAASLLNDAPASAAAGH
jgi:hypothetical protein